MDPRPRPTAPAGGRRRVPRSRHSPAVPGVRRSPGVIQARVLVVHDVPAVRQLVAHALETRGCTAIGVEDFRAATALDTLDPLDVVIADERLIDADPAAFRTVRRQFPRAIVVALSPPVHLRTSGGREGVDCTVEKPAQDDQLVRAILWALELARPDAQA